MELTQEAFEKLGTDKARMTIALELGVSYDTFRRWVKTDHSNLTKKATIQAIVTHTGMEEENIFKAQ